MSAVLDKIIAGLIDFFIAKFPGARDIVAPATDIPGTFNISDRAWAAYADVINRLSWMTVLGVRLKPADMARLHTILQLAAHIEQLVDKKAGNA
jgi:hypothetical protein